MEFCESMLLKQEMHGDREQQFFSIMNQYRVLKGKMRPKEITHGEFMIMRTIQMFMEENTKMNTPYIGVRLTELTKKINATMPATSKMLRGLEEKKYVKRVHDPEDKRVAYIELTKTGVGELERAWKTMSEFTNRIFAKMGDQDLNELFRLLNKLYSIMEEERNN